ncbi:MAG: HAMP domain-containing sensor histidine kinase [Azospirillaceae bacterium]
MGAALDSAIALAATGMFALAVALAALPSPSRDPARPPRAADRPDASAPARIVAPEARPWAAACLALAVAWALRALAPELPPADLALQAGLAGSALVLAAPLLLAGLATLARRADRTGRARSPLALPGLVALAALPLAAGIAGLDDKGLAAATHAFAGATLVLGGVVLGPGRAGRGRHARLAGAAIAAFGALLMAAAAGVVPGTTGLALPAAGLVLGTALLAAAHDRRGVEAEAALAAARRALARAEERMETRAVARAKTEFLANVSHELRTPLNAIIGFAEVIRDRHFGPDAVERYAECARDIHTSGTHLLAVLDDVLEMSRLEGGHYRLRREVVLIGEIAETCRRIVAGRAAERGLYIELEIDPATPPVLADRRACKQILINLLSNAIKFTPTGGRVVVFARSAPDAAPAAVGPASRPSGGIVFGVSDTGVGIPADELALVREPFRQGAIDPDRSGSEGTGLGLAIVDRLVSLLEAGLTIDSTPGVGTTVTVRLAADTSARADPALPAEEPAEAPDRDACRDVEAATA